MSYYECVLVDGKVLNFNKLCNYVSCSGKCGNMIEFRHEKAYMDADDINALLAMVPESQIKAVVVHHDTDVMDILMKNRAE